MIENKERELTLIYHSRKMDDKKARAFVESLDGYSIKSLDLAREKITPTQLAEVADKMNGKVTDLLDESYVEPQPGVSKEQKGLRNLEAKELLKMLAANTMLVSTPVVIIGRHAYHYGSAYDLVRKDLGRQGGSTRMANEEETDRGGGV